ncbi:MAG: methionine--tRNA ligase [Candidatus Marinimicrobia bacterium]|nr:methionine--tRNA ligase [Candidatus Neomarinimicrobiota bacterium]
MTAPYYITTPIYYVNDKPHIGHAYTTIACDVLARFKRLDGYEVKFLSGTDEHGQKVAKAAADNDLDPIELCDKNSNNFRELLATLNISNDDFIRTTEQRHKSACQALWRKLSDKGHIYMGKYSGWYAVRDEAYYDEAELTQSPSGDHLAPTGAVVEWMEEETYFFDLSKWQDKLLAFYDSNPDFIGPQSRFNEVYSFVKGGLKDISISRATFSWGIPVPGETKHVMYVWIDALTNYLTALGYPTLKDDYAKFWPVCHHMVGKDIIRFHCVYWPAFLMAANLMPPKKVYAHGWWTVEGQKMSKSLGNAIDPNHMVAEYGLDQMRFFLMREVPFGNDGDFSEAAISRRINGELANELGNLAQRVLSFIAKNLDGVLPEARDLTTEDKDLLNSCHSLVVLCRESMDRQAFHEVIESIWSVVRMANVYVDMQAPWVLKKTNIRRMETVLYILVEATRHIAILMQPFTPQAMSILLDQLSVPDDDRMFTSLGEGSALKSGIKLPVPHGVFPRYIAKSEERTR